MQEKKKRLTRETYRVPEGEEKVVHYLAEREMFEKGEKVSHPEIIKTGLKQFDMVKKSLELQGYKIRILYHPLGKYPAEEYVETKSEKQERELDEAQAKIKELEKELDQAKKESKAKRETKK